MKMGTPGLYLRGESLAGNSLHDLNVSDSRDPDIHGITDMDRDITERDELDNDDGSTSGGVCSSSVLRTISILMSDPLSCTLSFCSSYLCYFKKNPCLCSGICWFSRLSLDICSDVLIYRIAGCMTMAILLSEE